MEVEKQPRIAALLTYHLKKIINNNNNSNSAIIYDIVYNL